MSDTGDSTLGRLPGLAAGTVLDGKYEIVRRLGAGGMGVVYEARHRDLRKRVAIKMLAPDLAARDDLVARVVREARAASATGHPNIALVTDLGWVDRTPFFVMELVDGETLDALVSRAGPLSVSRAVAIVCQVLDALQAVHDIGIVHRDLKPSNVMLTVDKRRGPVVKLLDFGISKLADEGGESQEPDLTRPGAVMGTPRHMAPEQVLAEPDVDHRADIHSAGSLLYLLLVGHAPFDAPTANATMARVLEGRYAPATTLVAGLPTGLDAILAKAMSVKRDARFASAEAMRKVLLPFVDAPQGPTVAPGPPAIDPDDLPPLVAVSGTEVATHDRWPTVSGGSGPALPGTILPVGDPRLELDVPPGWRPGQRDAAPTVPRRAVAIPWGIVALVVGLLAAGWAAWHFRSQIESGASSLGTDAGGVPGEVVLLMIDATPKDVTVFVDDVQHAERPISIPKTGKYVKLRAEAPGYQSYVTQVQAVASRRLSFELQRGRSK